MAENRILMHGFSTPTEYYLYIFSLFRKKTPLERLQKRDRIIRSEMDRTFSQFIPLDINRRKLYEALDQLLIEYASDSEIEPATVEPDEYINNSCNLACLPWMLDVFCEQAIELNIPEAKLLAINLTHDIFTAIDSYFREADPELAFTEAQLLLGAPNARQYL